MRVMTFNVLCGGEEGHRWAERADDVTTTVRNYMPDIFGLQEAHLNWMKIFWKAFPEYDYVGVGRDDGKEEGEFSPVFYKKDKFDLIDKGWFWISETPDVPSKSWESCCKRICSWAKLKCKKCDKTFIAMNTHLDHRSELARKHGARLVKEFAQKQDCPVFITGDFNIPQNEDCYKEMIDGNIFQDAKFIAKETEDKFTFHEYDHHNGPRSVIDFIFVSNKFEVEKYKVIDDKINGRFPSDHCPVIAELKIIE